VLCVDGEDGTRVGSGQSVYTVFQGLEVMFHVSTLLPFRQRTDELGQQWERKQHIGFASPRSRSLALGDH
jgi:hypothetical protein